MKSEKHRQGIITAYQMAGTDFLALKLERIFRRIETDEDKVLHNDMVDEVSTLVGEPQRFLKILALGILRRKPRIRKSFFKEVVNSIMLSTKGNADGRRD